MTHKNEQLERHTGLRALTVALLRFRVT